MRYDSSPTASAAPQAVLFPWTQSTSQSSLRVFALSSSAKLFNSEKISGLLKDWCRLTLGGLGLACNVPAISSEIVLTEHFSANDDDGKSIPSVDKLSMIDSDVDMFKYASKCHIDASDQLLTVLSESVRVRVVCQDLRCHCCLLDVQRRKRQGTVLSADNINGEHCQLINSSQGTVDSECSLSTFDDTNGIEVLQTDDAKNGKTFNEKTFNEVNSMH